MKWLLTVTLILVAVSRIAQSAPMMEGCKRWRGCGDVDPKEPKTPEISIDDIPKDMARYCKYICKIFNFYVEIIGRYYFFEVKMHQLESYCFLFVFISLNIFFLSKVHLRVFLFIYNLTLFELSDLKKLLESKVDKFRGKPSQNNVPGFDLGAKRLRISRKLQAIVRRQNT